MLGIGGKTTLGSIFADLPIAWHWDASRGQTFNAGLLQKLKNLANPSGPEFVSNGGVAFLTYSASGGPNGVPMFQTTLGNELHEFFYQVPQPSVQPTATCLIFRIDTWVSTKFVFAGGGLGATSMQLFSFTSSNKVAAYLGNVSGSLETSGGWVRAWIQAGNAADDFLQVGSNVSVGNLGNAIPAPQLGFGGFGGATSLDCSFVTAFQVLGKPTANQYSQVDRLFRTRYGTAVAL